MKKNLEVFEKFLKVYPLSHALPRGLESLLFRELELDSPILDIGCGGGSFALLTFGKGKIDVGLDKDKKEIEKAEKEAVYRKVKVADAHEIPFPDGKFKTIIANSFLEHVKDPDKVLAECFRTLSSGGEMIFTVPSKSERKYWFWPKIFGCFYLRTVDRLMGHFPFHNKSVWIEKLKRAGFSKIKVSSYAPKKTVTLLDFLVPFSPFYYLTGRVFGPRKFIAKLFQSFFYVDKKKGLGYFFRAEKKNVNI